MSQRPSQRESAIGALFALFLVNDRRDHQLARAQAVDAWARYDNAVASCERGNVVRRYLNRIVESEAHLNRELPLIAIVNCGMSIAVPPYPRPVFVPTEREALE